MGKSYVTLEQNVCPVCGKVFETGNLLMDTRLRESFEKYTVTGYDYCEEHKKQKEDGYVFLIEVSERPAGECTLENADRTGSIASIRKHVADKIFGSEIKDIAFVEVGVLEKLQAMQG